MEHLCTTPGAFEQAQQDKEIETRLARIRHKILVMSGKGGVGKSTVASFLSLMLARERKSVGLLDVDLHGPSVVRLLGVEGGLSRTPDGLLAPGSVSENLQALSMEMLIGDRDSAVIWRGPMKISAIRQFISDLDWGDLDYLVVDAPPGTGDEPLTVAQTIPDAQALIVTTPQEIALADVRKSIDFCRQVGLSILGLVENMSGFVCAHCGMETPVFGKDGAARLAAQSGIPLLARLPLHPEMVAAGDRGDLKGLASAKDHPLTSAFVPIVERALSMGTPA